MLLFFRGCYYDKSVCSPEAYVAVACTMMEHYLPAMDVDDSNEECVGSNNNRITLCVDTRAADGAPNQAVDVAFVRLANQVLSDNYPERLKKYVITSN